MIWAQAQKVSSNVWPVLTDTLQPVIDCSAGTGDLWDSIMGFWGDYRTFAIQSAALVVPPVPSIALSISFMVVSVLELLEPS